MPNSLRASRDFAVRAANRGSSAAAPDDDWGWDAGVVFAAGASFTAGGRGAGSTAAWLAATGTAAATARGLPLSVTESRLSLMNSQAAGETSLLSATDNELTPFSN